MQEQFQQHIQNDLPFLKNARLLLAVSGGLDSVVLTHLCQQFGLDTTLAHCNFNLRGEESDGDEGFVTELANSLDLEVFIQEFETSGYADSHRLSTQMAARELRYNWFRELVHQMDFDYLLTAHHADDNLETFLINLSRGTGLDGLTGIPEVADYIVRPLLPFSRAALEKEAVSQGWSWREDSSNASNAYLRNRLRHDVIPVLKEMNPQFLQNFDKTISHLKENQFLIADAIKNFKNEVWTEQNDSIYLAIENMKGYPAIKPYLFHLLKDYNFTAWDDIVDLLNAQSGKQILSSTHQLVKDRDHLILKRIEAETNIEASVITANCDHFKGPFGTLIFEPVKTMSNLGSKSIFVDNERLIYPLHIRKWENGDVFMPLGMKGKKKVSKFLKDEKLSLIDKEKVWVLTSENQIVWVMGMRADDRYKVTDTTTDIIKIELL